tara:strand:+ start:6879 stop:7661 length:783 start_codon:yes stop_codon:yes gene_type:complete
MAKNDKEVAVKNEHGLPAELADEMALDAGAGQEDITAADVSIPFLRILQQMSPQCIRSKGEYIEGAQAGQIFNTVTGELWPEDDGPIIIPCSYNFKYILWADRSSKTAEGIQATFVRGQDLPPTTKDDRGRDITEEGHVLTPTSEFFVLIFNPETNAFEQAVMSLSSTQLTPGKKWAALIKQQVQQTAEGPKPAALFSRMYKAKTLARSNDDGDWSVWDINLHGVVEDIDLYRAAKSFSSAVNSGKASAKYADPEGDEVM